MVYFMALIIDGKSEHVAQPQRKIGQFVKND